MTLETIILGAGPAGTGSLVWAARHGLLSDWLDAGIALVESRECATGTIGRYVVNADTLGSTFLECLEGPNCEPELIGLRSDPVTLELMKWHDKLPPLELVGHFLGRLGVVLRTILACHPYSEFLAPCTARSIKLQRDGSVVALIERHGHECEVRAATAVMALGGVQNTSWQDIEVARGLSLGRWAQKVVPSDQLLARGGAAKAQWLLGRGSMVPRAVILGGAHSAFSSAWLLLKRGPRVTFEAGGIQILHRSRLKIFYPSREAAADDGCTFTEDDVCPATGRVFRLAGLRGDGRDVCRRMHGLGGLEREDRVVARHLDAIESRELEALLDTADLIVSARGYRLATIPVLDVDGRRIPLARSGPAVDHLSRLLTEDGQPLENLFGVGLGSGFKPWGPMAGEASFSGQQNSLWLYQNGLGQSIYDSVRSYAARFRGISESQVLDPLGLEHA